MPAPAPPRRAAPITVVALGGNAVSPPAGRTSWADERATVRRAMGDVASLAGADRLLIVHGNGLQVGRLLAARGVGDPAALDVHVAQTQGELGYLIVEALDAHLGAGKTVAVITRTLVDPDDPAFAAPTKPIGPLLARRPRGAAVRLPSGGWRRVVPSPRPCALVEEDAIQRLLHHHHVVAGGGGGVPLAGTGTGHAPVAAVVDKDWVAALLAIRLRAHRLFFLTDVPHASRAFGTPDERRIARLTVTEARALLEEGVFRAGSMAPKVESAVAFAAAAGRPAVITGLGRLAPAIAGRAGTTIIPDGPGTHPPPARARR